MVDYTSSELAERVIELVALHLGTVDELRDWAAGSATGGFFADGVTPGGGYYPFTAPDGFVRYIPCVAKLALVGGDPAEIEAIFADVQADVAAAKTAAEAAAGDAADDAAAALAFSLTAQGYKDDAEAGAAIATTKAGEAAASATTAGGHEDAAETHKLAAQAAAAAVVTDKYTRIGSKFDAEGFNFAAAVNAIATSGYLAAGDGGHALYKRVAAQPAHKGRLRSADRFLPDGTVSAANGGWWEIVDIELNARQFGAKADGGNDFNALQDFLDTMLAMGRAGSFGPGVFTITQAPLRINTTGDANTAVCGWLLRGAGRARFDGASPGSTAGTRIDYTGAAAADAIIRVENSFARGLAFSDFTLACTTAPTTAVVGGTTVYTPLVQNGIKLADTRFTFATFDRIGFRQVQRCIGAYKVVGANGEHVVGKNLWGQDVGQAFYVNDDQAYFHQFSDCSFLCFPNNPMFEGADPGSVGIGLSMHNINGGFYPADPAAKSVLVKYRGTSTVTWVGGRIEGITQLVDTSKGSAVNAAAVSFKGVEGTIFAGAGDINFMSIDGNENATLVTVEECNFQVSGGTKRNLVIYAPFARGRVTFRKTIFQDVLNIIPHVGSNYAVQIDYDRCLIDGQPAGATGGNMMELTGAHGLDPMLAQRYGSDNIMAGSGLRQNLLLECSFGFGPATAVQPAVWTPPAPWVVTGNGGQVKDAFRWNNGNAEQPWESAHGFVMIAGQKVEQSLPHITLSNGKLLRYRALMHVVALTSPNGFSEATPFRIALVNDADPTIAYAELRLTPTGQSTTPRAVELARFFSTAQGAPRLVFENKHDGDVRVTIFWQLVSDRRGPVAFAPTTTAAVLGSKDWALVPQNMAVLQRFQLPYKHDTYGVNGSLTEVQEGESYHSQNDGRRVTFAQGKWKREPVCDSKTGAPSSGTYALGEITFQSNPVTAGKAGWICVSAGSPGIHKPWGAIDA